MTVAIRLNGTVHYGKKYEAHIECLQRIVKELKADAVERQKLLDDIDAGTVPIEFGWPVETIISEPVHTGFRDDGEGTDSWRKRDYVDHAKTATVREVERKAREAAEVGTLAMELHSIGDIATDETRASQNERWVCEDENCNMCRANRKRNAEIKAALALACDEIPF